MPLSVTFGESYKGNTLWKLLCLLWKKKYICYLFRKVLSATDKVRKWIWCIQFDDSPAWKNRHLIYFSASTLCSRSKKTEGLSRKWDDPGSNRSNPCQRTHSWYIDCLHCECCNKRYNNFWKENTVIALPSKSVSITQTAFPGWHLLTVAEKNLPTFT